MKTILSSCTIIAFSLSRRSYSLAFSPVKTASVSLFSRTCGLISSSSRRNDFIKSTTLCMSASSSTPQITQIDKSQMNEIIQAVEGTDENYVIIDVRNVDEIDYTGKLSPVVHTLPLPYIVQYGVFNLDNEDFEDSFGFPKPEMDQTLVFTCKAGIRSMQAGQFAIQAGYTKIVNYTGGANDWFR